jgi:hypothetical protein
MTEQHRTASTVTLPAVADVAIERCSGVRGVRS